MIWRAVLIPLLYISACHQMMGVDQSQAPRILQAGSSRPLMVPNFGSLGEDRCASGHVFSDVDQPPSIVGSILEIFDNGSRSRTYQPLKQFSDQGLRFTDFAVSPSGSLYEIFQSPEETKLVEVDSDGSPKHVTKLDVPANVEERWAAIFNDGTSVFAGYFTPRAAAHLQGKSFVAIFQPSGRLSKKLSSYADVDPAHFMEKPLDGWVSAGEDGNAYILSGDKVLVVNEVGEVVRRLSFKKPDPAAFATRVDYAEGLLAIYLTNIDSKQRITMHYLVLYASTGGVFGYYEPSDDLGFDMCFLGHAGFIFRRTEGGQLKLVTAPLL